MNSMIMTKPHWHNHYEIYYLVSGERKYLINGRIYELYAGDIVLVPKGVTHKTSPVNSNEHERIVINVIEDWISPEVKKCFEHHYFKIPSSHKKTIMELFIKIEHEHQNLDEYSLSMIRQYIYELMVLLMRFWRDYPDEEADGVLSVMELAAQYINKNFHSAITLKSMSKKFSMSKEYFSKRFKQITGIGFNEYLSVVRISHAAKLLNTTDLSITEIAYLCGFNDSNYFSTVFYKLQGQTPNKYQKNNQVLHHDKSN